jgi:hypothetical protein
LTYSRIGIPTLFFPPSNPQARVVSLCFVRRNNQTSYILQYWAKSATMNAKKLLGSTVAHRLSTTKATNHQNAELCRGSSTNRVWKAYSSPFVYAYQTNRQKPTLRGEFSPLPKPSGLVGRVLLFLLFFLNFFARLVGGLADIYRLRRRQWELVGVGSVNYADKTSFVRSSDTPAFSLIFCYGPRRSRVGKQQNPERWQRPWVGDRVACRKNANAFQIHLKPPEKRLLQDPLQDTMFQGFHAPDRRTPFPHPSQQF